MNDQQEIVSLVDLIDRLIEVPEPAPVSLMPQTWGWAALAVIVIAALAYACRRGIVSYRANAYRRAALAALDAVGDDAAGVAAVLRRTALAAYPRREVAGLTGAAWLEFLDAHARGAHFDERAGRSLTRAPYAGPATGTGLSGPAREWVRRHEAARSARNRRDEEARR